MTVSAREVRVAPNIFKTPYGWRVYVWRRGVLKPVRFKPDVTLEELEHFRDSFKLESKRLRLEARRANVVAIAELAGTFEGDAEAYLALETVKAMPSYADRVRDISLWAKLFGRRPRKSITTRAINEQLQLWRNAGYAASTVNNRRTALMALFSTLDGRAAANPVRESRTFDEPELEARGLPYDLVVRILDAIPAVRSYSHLRDTKTRPVKTRVRLEVMAWTGMRPAQLALLRREQVNFKERWFLAPRSKKGKTGRHPRPLVRKPLTTDAVAALRRFFAFKCEGRFSTSSARRLFVRAVRDVEKQLRRKLPLGIRPYDLRHSFGTEMLRRTKSLETVAELLDHSSTRMTKRYALGAVTDVLREAVTAFEGATTRGQRRPMLKMQVPKAPRRRAKMEA
jgi:integrase